MSIEIPPSLAWAASLAVGQEWPQGDEDKLLALGTAWEEAARELDAVGPELQPIIAEVLASIAGPTVEQFRGFTSQLLTNLRQMAESADQLSQLARTTGVEIEYTKYMILVQLVWMAMEIAQWVLFAPEVVPAVLATGRLAVQMILRRLLAAVGMMVGTDAAIQSLQMLKDDRTHWNVYNTLQAAEPGAIGGLFFGGGAVLAPKFAQSLLGRLALGGATGAASTAAMGGIDLNFPVEGP